MKKIKLTTSSPFFRPEQFDTEMFNGNEIPVMKISKQEYLNESFMFSLYSRELDAIPYEKNDAERKYLCVTDSFYIVVERGEKGFETSFHYFLADVKTANGEIAVNIKPVEDKAQTDAISDKFIENEFSSADCFNEKNIASSKNRDSLEHLKMIEATEFIRLPYKGNQQKLEVCLNTNGNSKFYISHNWKYERLDNGKRICGEAKIGELFYTRDKNVRNMVEIVKLQCYAHDFNGDFWAIIETAYSYPADAEKIKSEFPDFYNRECASDAVIEKQTLIEKAKELPYVRAEYKIGDGIIHIPIETTAAEISIPINELHFAAGDNSYGHLTRRDKARLRLNNLPLLCSLVEINRRFKLLYYKVCGFVKCGDNYYAELKFERQSNFYDSLDADLINFQDWDYETKAADKNAMACAGYLMFRNMIKPVMLSKDELGSNITEE